MIALKVTRMTLVSTLLISPSIGAEKVRTNFEIRNSPKTSESQTVRRIPARGIILFNLATSA